ncbi:MAG: hypothetical protein NWR21_12155 [Verrucomicrobiales bacterium]|nr:hypothetical protein [Verrucomicrobiales bacterium]MDP4940053.1 hypothetical protein [Verrucomicrobiales bacterium]MDP5004318.1 hypothetical protein [Verrucomicrobiales bacterium]
MRLQCSRTSPPSGSLSAGCLGAPAALLGSTTEIYLHVATGANGLGVVSPLDQFPAAPPCAVHSLTLMATAAA